MTIVQANEFVQSCAAEYTPDAVVAGACTALGCAKSKVHYLAIAGTAGKTCVASLEASVLRAAGFAQVGCYCGGIMPLRARILVGEKQVPAAIYTAAVAAVQKLVQQPDFFDAFSEDFAATTKLQQLEQPEDDADTIAAAAFGFQPMHPLRPAHTKAQLSLAAVEFLVACLCFTKCQSSFAVLELPEPGYAAALPIVSACAITQIGVDEQGHSLARAAKAACGLLRKGVAVITSPAQPEEVLDEISKQAKEIGAPLTIPELDDFTPKKHRRLQNRMDYGGYDVILPYLGEHAAQNAAIAIELALAVWRTGFDISDEAILEGLSLAENESNVLPLQYTPMLVVDACHHPLQAAALAQWVKAEEYQALSVIVGFTGASNLEAFFSALETGVVVDKDNPEKEQLPGMSDNAFDKIYAVTPECDDAVLAAETVSCGKFHFEIQPCKNLAAALAQAQADANDGVLVCGSAALVHEVKQRMR